MVFRSPDHKASSEVETGGYAVASSSTDDVVVMQKEHITSSGLRTIVYAKKYQSPVETTGYIIVYEQGIIHVMFLQRAFMRWIAISSQTTASFPTRILQKKSRTMKVSRTVRM